MKGDGRADGGLGLMVGIVDPKLGGPSSQRVQIKMSKKIGHWRDREATGV